MIQQAKPVKKTEINALEGISRQFTFSLSNSISISLRCMHSKTDTELCLPLY